MKLKSEHDSMNALKTTTGVVAGLAVGVTAYDVIEGGGNVAKNLIDIGAVRVEDAWDGIVKVCKKTAEFKDAFKDMGAHTKDFFQGAQGAAAICGIGSAAMMYIGNMIHRNVKKSMKELEVQKNNYSQLVDQLVQVGNMKIKDLPDELGLLAEQFKNLREKIAMANPTIEMFSQRIQSYQVMLESGGDPEMVSKMAKIESDLFDKQYNVILQAFTDYIEKLKELKEVIVKMRKKAEEAKKSLWWSRICFGMSATLAVAGFVIMCIPGINVAAGTVALSVVGLFFAVGMALKNRHATFKTEEEVDEKIKALKKMEDQIDAMIEKTEREKADFMKSAKILRDQLEGLKNAKTTTDKEYTNLMTDLNTKNGA